MTTSKREKAKRLREQADALEKDQIELENAIMDSLKPDGHVDVVKLFFHPNVLKSVHVWLTEELERARQEKAKKQ